MSTYILMAAAGLFVVCSIFAVYRYFTTVYVVVHPWDLGGTRAEAEAAFNRSECFGRLSPAAREALVQRHVAYYQRLAFGLRLCISRFVVLLETRPRMEDSCRTLRRMLPWFCTVICEESKNGRATPARGSWDALAYCLKRLHARRVFFVGSYVGVCRGRLIDPRRMYFCINDAVLHLQQSGWFKVCRILLDYCYVKEVDGLDDESAGRQRRQPREKRKLKTKRGKKR